MNPTSPPPAPEQQWRGCADVLPGEFQFRPSAVLQGEMREQWPTRFDNTKLDHAIRAAARYAEDAGVVAWVFSISKTWTVESGADKDLGATANLARTGFDVLPCYAVTPGRWVYRYEWGPSQ